MPDLPVGSIIICPSDDLVPSGWHICDGTSGTPNLQGKEVPGAGGSYAVGDTGGSANWVLPPHEHALGTTALGNGSGHNHDWDFALAASVSGPYPADPGIASTAGIGSHTHTGTTTDGSVSTAGGDHTHDLGGVFDNAGVTGYDKLPGTRALHFIQRLS